MFYVSPVWEWVCLFFQEDENENENKSMKVDVKFNDYKYLKQNFFFKVNDRIPSVYIYEILMCLTISKRVVLIKYWVGITKVTLGIMCDLYVC